MNKYCENLIFDSVFSKEYMEMLPKKWALFESEKKNIYFKTQVFWMH